MHKVIFIAIVVLAAAFVAIGQSPLVPNLTYSAATWTNNMGTPTMHAVSAKIESISAGPSGNWTASGTTNSLLAGGGFVHDFTVTNDLAWGNIALGNTLQLTNALAEEYGGTGTNVYAKGDILVAKAGQDLDRLAVGADDQILIADSTTAFGVRWGASGGGDALTANPLSQFAATSSLQLAGVLTDETGSAEGGLAVFSNIPTIEFPTFVTGFTLNGSSSGATIVNPTAVASGTITIPAATDTLVGKATTDTFTNKTLDAAGTGNVLKQTKYILFQRPDYGDGVGAIPQTNTYTASGMMHYTFSGTAETNANWVVYEADVPPDIDTSVAMTATLAFVSGGTDADDVTFHITYALGASGTALPSGTAISTSPIVMTVTPTSPASGDVQTTAAVTLTGWAVNVTAGTPLFIRVARLNTTNDDSAREMYLRIAYGSTL